MKRILIALFALTAAVSAQATEWVAGRHYVAITPQRPQVPKGKVEVLEVFSYGCPACNQYRATMKRIQEGLPKNAQLAYLPASWNAPENWPTFQRAFLTAQALGIADRAHDAMYEAIWNTGELGIFDLSTGRLKRQLPSLQDIARLYERVAGVKVADFMRASQSPVIAARAKDADKQILAMRVSGTPTIVVAGKYRIENRALGPNDDIVELIRFLVAKETAATSAAPKPATAPAAKKP